MQPENSEPIEVLVVVDFSTLPENEWRSMDAEGAKLVRLIHEHGGVAVPLPPQPPGLLYFTGAEAAFVLGWLAKFTAAPSLAIVLKQGIKSIEAILNSKSRKKIIIKWRDKEISAGNLKELRAAIRLLEELDGVGPEPSNEKPKKSRKKKA